MKKEEMEKYTTLDIEQCKWWVNHLFNIAKETAFNSNLLDDAKEIQSAQDKIIKLLGQESGEDAKKQYEPMWIPVGERLPEKGKQVLCCNKSGSVFTSAITYINSNGMVAFGQHYEVIAWMPLPEAYKENEE